MVLQQPGGAQAIQNLLAGFGEVAVVQDLQASVEFQAHGNNGTGALDQLMTDYVNLLEHGSGQQGQAGSTSAAAGD
jgi:hypothetical protein